MIIVPQACKNTDKEIWREKPGDHYSPSIHVTADGAIGISVDGMVIVRSVKEWHRLARTNKPIFANDKAILIRKYLQEIIDMSGRFTGQTRYEEDHVYHLCDALAQILVGPTEFSQKT